MGRILKLLTSALAQCSGKMYLTHVISSNFAVARKRFTLSG